VGGLRPGSVGPPEHLSDAHHLDGFDSGVRDLDTWLLRRARPNEVSGASRTYVACADGPAGSRVVGYYALATGAVAQAMATGRVRRSMPEPIPVMVLARLAVDRGHQGQGLGSALLRDALLRTLAAASIAGIRAVLLHTISDDDRRFYEHEGFASSPIDAMTMMVTLADLRRALDGG